MRGRKSQACFCDHRVPERRRSWTLLTLMCWGQYIRSHTRVSDMQSGSLTATPDMLSCTQLGHETRSLRSWNSSLRMWAHVEHLSQTGHKSTNHGVSTRCNARMAFSRSTHRLTLHRRMAKSSAYGALSKDWQGACSRRWVCQNKSGLMLWLQYSLSKTDVSTQRTTVCRKN